MKIVIFFNQDSASVHIVIDFNNIDIVSLCSFSLRNNPMALSETDVSDTIRQHDFFEKYINPEGMGFYTSSRVNMQALLIGDYPRLKKR